MNLIFKQFVYLLQSQPIHSVVSPSLELPPGSIGSYCPQIAHTHVVVFSRSCSPFSARPEPDPPPLALLLLLPLAFVPLLFFEPSLMSSSNSLYFGASDDFRLFLLVTIFITFELFSCLNTDMVVSPWLVSMLVSDSVLLLLLAVLCLVPPTDILILFTPLPTDGTPRSPRPRTDTWPRPRAFVFLEPGVETFMALPGVWTLIGLYEGGLGDSGLSLTPF